jgi:hypothetical protein
MMFEVESPAVGRHFVPYPSGLQISPAEGAASPRHRFGRCFLGKSAEQHEQAPAAPHGRPMAASPRKSNRPTPARRFQRRYVMVTVKSNSQITLI